MRLPKHRERGAAAVEFALILPVLLMLVGGVIDFGVMYYKQIELTNAARDGVRQIVVNQSTGGWPAADIQARVRQAASPLTLNTTFTLQRSTDNGASWQTATVWYCQASGNLMRLTISPQTPYDYTVLKFLPGLPTPALTGTATMTCG
jgi:Flp pilus assembly protein TadG